MITLIQGWCKWRSIQPCTSSWNGCYQKGNIFLHHHLSVILVFFAICPYRWFCDYCPFPFQGLCFFGGRISTSSHVCGCPEKASHEAFPWGSWKAWYDWQKWKHSSRLVVLVSHCYWVQYSWCFCKQLLIWDYLVLCLCCRNCGWPKDLSSYWVWFLHV
jgi:hypothetical protein